MLFPLEKLINKKPRCLKKDAKIKEALEIMIKKDYDQLPVIDDQGNLIGIVSNTTFVRKSYHLGGHANILDLTVDHFISTPVTMTLQNNLFEALDRLKDTYAIVVIQDRKPIGILTDYDTTKFFREISEGLMLAENIELNLRQIIETVYSDEAALNHALIGIFGSNTQDPQKPKKEYQRLTLGETLHFITNEKTWPHFQTILGPRDIFDLNMKKVREIRNQLAHFRGRLDPIQRDDLHLIIQWLATRPLPTVIPPPPVIAPATTPTPAPAAPPPAQKPPAPPKKPSAKAETTRKLTFAEIEKTYKKPLPDDAHKNRQWWKNKTYGKAWLEEGWEVVEANLPEKTVTFRRIPPKP